MALPKLIILVMLGVQAGRADKSREATQLILGGSWFTESDTGESNGYLMNDFREKVLNPLIHRIASHIYENHDKINNMEWAAGILGAWMFFLTAGLVYRYLYCRKVKKGAEARQQLEVRQV